MCVCAGGWVEVGVCGCVAVCGCMGVCVYQRGVKFSYMTDDAAADYHDHDHYTSCILSLSGHSHYQ